jgi:hypothetical protein
MGSCVLEKRSGSVRRRSAGFLSDVEVNLSVPQRILSNYVDYYNGTRTHLSLYKDAPRVQPIQPPEQGRVVELERVGGLHHEYVRMAA